MLRKQKGFLMSYVAPIKHGQQVKDLLTALILASEIALIKIEAHTERMGPEDLEDALADFDAKYMKDSNQQRL